MVNKMKAPSYAEHFDPKAATPAKRESARPRDPATPNTMEEISHAEFILSTRETQLTLVKE